MTTPGRPNTRTQRGVAIPLVALCAVVLVGIAALAIDVGFAYQQRREAQVASDGAALAAALVGRDGGSRADMASAAMDYANLVYGVDPTAWTGCTDGGALATVSAATGCVSFDDTRVRVAVPGSDVQFLSQVLGASPLSVAADATAIYTLPTPPAPPPPAGGGPCALCALGGPGDTGQGAATFDLNGAGRWTVTGGGKVASNGGLLIQQSGPPWPKLDVPEASAFSYVSCTAWNPWDGTFPVTPASKTADVARCVPVAGHNGAAADFVASGGTVTDPYAAVPDAPPIGATRSFESTCASNPCVVQDDGRAFTGPFNPLNNGWTVRFCPGEYQFATPNAINLSGRWEMAATSDCANNGVSPDTGTGVALFFYGTDLNMQGSAVVSLSPPTSGPYVQTPWFWDRASGGKMGFAASSFSIGGDLYLPTAEFRVNNGPALTISSGIIAKTISNQHSQLVIDLGGGGGTPAIPPPAPAPVPAPVRLID